MDSSTGRRDPRADIRVAFVIGTLGQGGTEKQCLYMIRSLLDAGIEVRTFCIGRSEYHERSLTEMGVPPTWIGRVPGAPARMALLAFHLAQSRPDIVQATHTYVNVHAAAAARTVGAISIGAVRSNLDGCLHAYGRWTAAMLKMPSAVIANSRKAVEQMTARRNLCPRRTFLVPNALDLGEFDAAAELDWDPWSEAPARFRERRSALTVATVCRLVGMKRVDRFLRALALLKERGEAVRGVVAGDGPERSALAALASILGLTEADVWFAGACDRVPRLLRCCDALVFCSDDLEGFPNTIMEAMAAGLPVVSTRAGDAAELVKDGSNGCVVPFDDGTTIASRLSELAGNPGIRHSMAEAARAAAERQFGLGMLQGNLLSVYGALSFELGNRKVARSLEAARTGVNEL